MSDVTVGSDGMARCPWGVSSPEYLQYHDEEWGRPVSDETRVYEKLCLEGFQSGLSWLTILRKRDAFRRAFAGFEPATVATFDDADVARLLSDPAIVRHRGKIVATINNARATVRLAEAGRSLAATLWSHEPPEREPPAALEQLPGATAESRALSDELRRLGFRFVGPTTVYAAMQSLGVVNDHLRGCHFQDVVESQRARFARP